MAAKEKFDRAITDRTDEYLDFPNDPYERLGHVLGGVVNMATKSALVWCFPPYGEYSDVQELAERFRKLARHTPFEHCNASTISAYCSESLVGAGLVAQVFELQHPSVPLLVGFSFTEAGEKYAKRASALALRLEGLYKDIDLYEAFGATATSSPDEVRAPYIRARILLTLPNDGSVIDFKSLATELEFTDSSTIYRAIKILIKSGLIYQTSENEFVLSENGNVVREEFIHPLLNLLSDDTDTIALIDDHIAPFVNENPEVIESAINRYAPHSRAVRWDRMKEVDRELLQIIQSFDVISKSEINRLINEPIESISKRIERLVKTGKIVKITVGHRTYFSLPGAFTG